ncbi:MAG: transglutaminase domain-containing protein [Planctomycetes bacterium]|nr:transglutaminase domain-containing protein [Planctomycetota bacterium]
MIVLTILCAAAAGQDDTRGAFNPNVGKLKTSFAARTSFSAGQAVTGQAADMETTLANVSMLLPLYQDKYNELSAAMRFDTLEISTAAILPDTGEAFPEDLRRVGLTTIYRRLLENDWIVGAALGVASAGDKPFDGADETALSGQAFLRVPRGRRNAWMFFLHYASELDKARNYPIPGVAYFYAPDDDFQTIIGLPMLWARYKPVDALTLEARYLAPLTAELKTTYDVTKDVKLYAKYNSSNMKFVRHDRTDSDHRLFYYQQSVKVALRSEHTRHFWTDIGIGYAFDRFFFEGENYSDRRMNRLNIAPGPFAAVQIGWNFRPACLTSEQERSPAMAASVRTVKSSAKQFLVKDILVGRADEPAFRYKVQRFPATRKDDWTLASGWKAGAKEVKLGKVSLIGNAFAFCPAVELRITGLRDGWYMVRGKLWAYGGRGKPGKISYLYGYGRPSSSREHILLGYGMTRPRKGKLDWYNMADAQVRAGMLRIFLGPMVCRGEGQESFGYLHIGTANVWGAWQAIEIQPISDLPSEINVDGGRYVYKKRIVRRVISSAKNSFTVNVGGDLPPRVESVGVESLDAVSRTPWLLTPSTLDYSSVRRLAQSIISPGMSEEQKAVAIFDFLVGPVLYHTTRAKERGKTFADTMKTLNVYGYGWCLVHATVFQALARSVGLNVEVETGPGHRWNRIKLNGKWRFLDPDHALVQRDKHGQIPSRRYLFNHPDEICLNGDEYLQTPKGQPVEFLRRAHPDDCHASVEDDRGQMRFELRPGESLQRNSLPAPLNVNLWSSPRQNYMPVFGFAVLRWAPRKLTAGVVACFKHVAGIRLSRGALVLKPAARRASFVLPVRSAYVIRKAKLSLKCRGEIGVSVKSITPDQGDAEWIQVKPPRGGRWNNISLRLLEDIYAYDVKITIVPASSGG